MTALSSTDIGRQRALVLSGLKAAVITAADFCCTASRPRAAFGSDGLGHQTSNQFGYAYQQVAR